MTQEPLVIHKGCFLGDNSVIIGGVTLAPNCIIGACAFVNKNTEPNGVYVGAPARRLRDVDESEIKSME